MLSVLAWRVEFKREAFDDRGSHFLIKDSLLHFVEALGSRFQSHGVAAIGSDSLRAQSLIFDVKVDELDKLVEGYKNLIEELDLRSASILHSSNLDLEPYENDCQLDVIYLERLSAGEK